jgi:hypothetical protein
MEKTFSDKEKMFLRQTDRLYHLEEINGKLELKFVKFWQDSNVKIMSPDSFKITSHSEGSVKPCSAEWSMTHNPAIFTSCALSHDLVHDSKNDITEWSIFVPEGGDKRYSKEQHLLPLLRLPASAQCGVKNIKIKINDNELVLPVTLEQGEYLSIPHDTKWGCIYDAETHNIKREFYLPQFNSCWYLPNIKRGQTNKVALVCDPIEKGKSISLILNLRYWNDILPK